MPVQYTVVATKYFFNRSRERIVADALRESKKTGEELGVEIQRRVRREEKLPGEEAANASLTAQEDLQKDLYACYDKLVVEQDARFDAALHMHTIFAGLSPKSLLEDTEEKLINKYEPLNQAYTSDLNLEKLRYEVLRLSDFVKAASELDVECDIRKAPGIEWLKWICQWQLQEVVPNLTIAFRLFLTLTISAATAERSFSELKLAKLYLRLTMSQE